MHVDAPFCICPPMACPDEMKTTNATLRGRAGPAWAWLRPELDSLFELALSGWKNLEEAVLIGDDGLSNDLADPFWKPAHVRWDHYLRRLPFLPRDVDDIAASCKCLWPETVNQIELLAIAYLRLSLVDAPITRSAFCGGVEFLLDSVGLDQVEFDETIRSPVKLLKLAYAQLLALPDRSNDGFVLASFWLVLLGSAVEKLRYPECQLCFRHALHGHQYCFMHSQAIEFDGTKAQKARRHYLGKMTAHELNWNRRKPVIRAHREIDTPILIARHLWGSSPHRERSLFNRIRRGLAGSPNVQQLLGKQIPQENGALDALLRDKLDPLELLPEAWPEKIALAERWLSCEQRQTPSVRGKSQALDAKIKRAERFASKGMSLEQIAKALGCSIATIRSWCSRGRAQRLSQILSDQNRSISSAYDQDNVVDGPVRAD
jgi:hypothetical protein